MRLAETHYNNAETGCCARLDVGKWDEKTFTWKDKPFLRDHIRAFLHMPLNFGSVISRDHALVEQAALKPKENTALPPSSLEHIRSQSYFGQRTENWFNR